MHFGSLFSDGNSKDEQGDWGEFRVNNMILRIKDQLGECYLYKDIYIESNDVTYQIDHLLRDFRYRNQSGAWSYI